MTDLFGAAGGSTAIDAAVDDAAWLAAWAQVQTALARAATRAGRIDLPVALEIGAAASQVASAERVPLVQAAQDSGSVEAALADRLGAAVHARSGAAAPARRALGATAHDVLDTVAVLVTGRALGVIGADVQVAADRAAALARIHRDTAQLDRTAGIAGSFGLRAAGWAAALDRAADRLSAVRATLPAPLSAGGSDAAVLRAAFADELDLAAAGAGPDGAEVRADLAAALGPAGAALVRVATDVISLAQPGIGELRERGARTPAGAAAAARTALAPASGLVATLLDDPGADAWPVLRELLRAVGGAASRLAASLTALEVDIVAMLDNLGDIERPVGPGGDLVDRFLSTRAAGR